MEVLTSKGKSLNINELVIGKVIHSTDLFTSPSLLDTNSILILDDDEHLSLVKHKISGIITSSTLSSPPFNTPTINNLSNQLSLANNDIVSLYPNGVVRKLFRTNSPHNTLFITDRCNSNCLMCSQPPKNKDDLDIHFYTNMRLVELIPKETKVIGITGGEPTILGERLNTLLAKINYYLPNTHIHILTNGRVFNWKHVVKRIHDLNTSNIVFAVPLYSDYYLTHDYIVQAKDAFTQTIIGLHNLAYYNQRVEIRFVLHKASVNRLPQFAHFIYKNIPFVEHITFMGLEYTGYTPYNHDLLWIEPKEYMENLQYAINYLAGFGMDVSIYNHPLCLVPASLWEFTKNSISDWKVHYLEECQKCGLKNECGGVFGTSRHLSQYIKAF